MYNNIDKQKINWKIQFSLRKNLFITFLQNLKATFQATYIYQEYRTKKKNSNYI